MPLVIAPNPSAKRTRQNIFVRRDPLEFTADQGEQFFAHRTFGRPHAVRRAAEIITMRIHRAPDLLGGIFGVRERSGGQRDVGNRLARQTLIE